MHSVTFCHVQAHNIYLYWSEGKPCTIILEGRECGWPDHHKRMDITNKWTIYSVLIDFTHWPSSLTWVICTSAHLSGPTRGGSWHVTKVSMRPNTILQHIYTCHGLSYLLGNFPKHIQVGRSAFFFGEDWTEIFETAVMEVWEWWNDGHASIWAQQVVNFRC
jgi:hypothetical protein